MEMQLRRDKGLCYNCDEKFAPGHRCKSRQLFLLDSEEELLNDTTEEISPTDTTLVPMADPIVRSELSYHALAGQISPTTLRLLGYIAGSPVQILVDGGSTHNFIQSRVARHLGLTVEASPQISVLVGNGDRLSSDGSIKQQKVKLSSHDITVDLFVLPLFGADVVLGVQWLAQLGPVLFDYSKLTLEFVDGETRVQLVGEPQQPSSLLQYHHIRRLAQIHSMAALFHIEYQPVSHPSPVCDNAELSDILQSFASVFDTPQGLPPSRDQDHFIHLLPGSQPVNVKPYRYPHFQKSEIEKLVTEMLREALFNQAIAPSLHQCSSSRKRMGHGGFA
ncbi:uncharacterized protein LOC143852956 [Tasmannia lanceolata]|uniref:uncharacterized protein LOC143852956 n=1 Tax=Tasmannia lanceolata TaxID=3420 RepID=UPI004063DCD2